MSTEPKTMQDLHKIREQMHEEQKNWTPQQVVAFYEKEVALAQLEFGLHIKRPPVAHQKQRKAG